MGLKPPLPQPERRGRTRRKTMIKLLVPTDRLGNRTIHLLNPDSREIAVPPDDTPLLAKVLKKAYSALGIPRDEPQRRLLPAEVRW
jgi:hypothetical protein